ncbi:MAG: hypothetical protein K9L25_05550 [Methylovulum sp.]|nr:hypothetical protein [Methylovulum sp.]
MFKSKLAILLVTLTISGAVSATNLISPKEYTGTQGESSIPLGGTLSYFDDTGNQLTDKIIGKDDFSANLGYGAAHEWVGWITTDPTINFIFDEGTKISQVLIGFNRMESVGIFLPKKVTINGKVFELKGNEIANVKRGYLKFNGSFSGSTLNIVLEDGDSQKWIFVDEIQFISPTIEGTAPWQTAHTVICENTTQSKSVLIKATKSSNWDCGKAGLSINSGDKVKVTIEGTKY